MSPTWPPGRQTRASSAAVTSCRGANCTPNTDRTWSKDSLSNGRSSASPSTHVDVDAVLGGATARGDEQLRREVQADDVGAGGGCTQGHVARAGGDVEDVLPRRDGDAAEQVAGGTVSMCSATAA